MRLISIVLFLLVLQVSMATIGALNILPNAHKPILWDWFTDVEAKQDNIQERIGTEKTLPEKVFEAGMDFLKGLVYFAANIGWGIIAVPYTLALFGIISPFSTILSVPIYFIYSIGAIQFMANRGFKGMF